MIGVTETVNFDSAQFLHGAWKPKSTYSGLCMKLEKQRGVLVECRLAPIH